VIDFTSTSGFFDQRNESAAKTAITFQLKASKKMLAFDAI
jgi:hypothetical protein